MANSKTLSPAAQKVFDSIWDEIIFGHLAPGQRLVESELMERFDTYRASVREALRELVNKGLALHLPNKGVSVLKLHPLDIEKIYDVRTELEALAVKWIEFPVGCETIDRLEAVQNQHSQAIKNGDLRTVFRANNKFHAIIYSLCENPFLEDTIAELAQKSLTVRFHPYLDHNFLKLVESEHLQMIAAIKSGNRQILEDLIKQHVPQAKNRYIKSIKARGMSTSISLPTKEKTI